jgi:hypothetical protein
MAERSHAEILAELQDVARKRREMLRLHGAHWTKELTNSCLEAAAALDRLAAMEDIQP